MKRQSEHYLDKGKWSATLSGRGLELQIVFGDFMDFYGARKNLQWLANVRSARPGDEVIFNESNRYIQIVGKYRCNAFMAWLKGRNESLAKSIQHILENCQQRAERKLIQPEEVAPAERAKSPQQLPLFDRASSHYVMEDKPPYGKGGHRR